MNNVFWNCQGLRPKRKKLENYLQENQIDILALNEKKSANEMLFFIAEFERAAKSRKIAVYHFLISLLVSEL